TPTGSRCGCGSCNAPTYENANSNVTMSAATSACTTSRFDERSMGLTSRGQDGTRNDLAPKPRGAPHRGPPVTVHATARTRARPWTHVDSPARECAKHWSWAFSRRDHPWSVPGCTRARARNRDANVGVAHLFAVVNVLWNGVVKCRHHEHDRSTHSSGRSM